MIIPKFFTIYNYQKEIFSIIISSITPTVEIPSLTFADFLSRNNNQFGYQYYDYTAIDELPRTKFGVVENFDSYLINCSCYTAPMFSAGLIDLSSQYFIGVDSANGEISIEKSSSFYSRCQIPSLKTNVYDKVNSIKELDCVYENGMVSSAFFIKDLKIWKHEYINYYLCYQSDISNNINSISNFNKFNTDVDDISSSRSIGLYYLMHSFIKNADYNRKNVILKTEFLLKKHFSSIFNPVYKIVDYSAPVLGSLILKGKNGADLHIQYFNSIKFYAPSEIASINSTFDQRNPYLKNEDAKYSTLYDLRGSSSESIKLPPAKFDSKGFPIKRYVKVTKMTPETRSALIKRDLVLEKITEVIPNNFSYPFSALVATKLDSRSISNLPSRSFDCKLKKILVPSNYYPLDGIGRDLRYSQSRGSNIIYKGTWDGTFKLSWTDNPAWILMDLLINKRYGLGNYINSNQIDIWELYQIAKWCDACDENGIFWGVPDTYSGYEPRYTFNALINEKYNVYDMINNIMSLFNGNVYYSNSIISFNDNRLKDIAGTISSTDVLDGLFNFGNFKKDDEFTAIEIAFLDKRDSYKTKMEYIEDTDAIRKRGLLKKTITPMGITTRGQAIRHAKNILFQTAKESNNVSFSIDSKILSYGVGDLIKVSTDAQEKKQMGKLLEYCKTTLNEVKIFIDTCLNPNFFDTCKIDILTRKQFSKDGQSYFDAQKCTYFIKGYQIIENDTQVSGTYVTFHNSGIQCSNNFLSTKDFYHNQTKYSLVPKYVDLSDFNETSMYSLTKRDKKDNIYKIMSITENSASEFSVFATEFCSTKFEIIEGESPRDINTDNYFYVANLDNSMSSRPSAVFFSAIEKITNITPTQNGIKVTWKALPNIDGYNLYIIKPSSQKQIFVRSITGTSTIFSGIPIGGYDAVKKEYYYIFLESTSSVGTFQLGIESFVLEYNNTFKRTSEITNKSFTL